MKVFSIFFVVCIFNFVTSTEHVLNNDYMMDGDETHLGPEMDTVYQPGKVIESLGLR